MARTDNWATPQWLKDYIFAMYGGEMFDPCPLPNADGSLNPDGLLLDWYDEGYHGVFVNPPYSKWGVWAKKCYEEYQKGADVCLLIFSRTDTKAWHDYCMRAQAIEFIEGRVSFIRWPDNYENLPNVASVMVHFRHDIAKRQEEELESAPYVWTLRKSDRALRQKITYG